MPEGKVISEIPNIVVLIFDYSKNSALYECLEKYVFSVSDHDLVFKAKEELMWQFSQFKIIIDADRFFEINRNIISTVYDEFN